MHLKSNCAATMEVIRCLLLVIALIKTRRVLKYYFKIKKVVLKY